MRETAGEQEAQKQIGEPKLQIRFIREYGNSFLGIEYFVNLAKCNRCWIIIKRFTMQKTIGLIGGMSWESSLVYYKIINQEVKKSLGEAHSCQSLMYSVDFEKIAKLQHNEDWDELGDIISEAAQRLELGGADLIILCTNTMHKLADKITAKVKIPLIHIADATADEIKSKKIKKVGLLGTKFTMEQDFLKGRLKDNHAIETIIPNKKQREVVHKIIYEELVKGIITNKSKQEYLKIMDDLIDNGAEGIILGCTEISLLITPEITKHILFDTTDIHAKKAVELSLK